MSKNNFDRYFKVCRNCKYNGGKIDEKTDLLRQQLRPVNYTKVEIAKHVAESLGGKCLSDFSGSKYRMTFECSKGHVFRSKYTNVVNLGTWCPYCAQENNISEEIVRCYFEQMFGERFVRIRPQWLLNRKKNRLELDGFCKQINVAFEHQGNHHYKDSYKGGRLQSVKNNDKDKMDKCKEKGVALFVIEHLFKMTKLKDLRSTIIRKAHDLGVHIPYPDVEVDISKAYTGSKFNEYKAIAESKGGKCLSSEYCGACNKKLIWQCAKGHKWRQYPYVLKKGHWCPQCSNQPSRNIIQEVING
jgi:hypothetical protein